MRRTRGVLLGFTFAVATIGVGVGGTAPPAAAQNPGAVQWRFEHGKNQVVAKVNVAYYPKPSLGPKWHPGYTKGLADGMNKAFVRAWEGVPLACYKLHIEITSRVVDELAQVPDDAVGVMLVSTPYDVSITPGQQHKVDPYTRSYIETQFASVDNYLSDDPSARNLPTTGSAYANDPNPLKQNRVWTSDPRPLNMSHEFGHILGLNDNYDSNFKLREGAVNDLMFNGGTSGAGKLYPESITKVVRRSGLDLTEMNCSRHLESIPFDMELVPFEADVALQQFYIEADNCTWLPPSSDPQQWANKNVWQGKLTYSPYFKTTDNVGGLTINPVFTARGDMKEKVRFETLTIGTGNDVYQPGKKPRWWSWEDSKVLFDDGTIEVRANLQLRELTDPKAEEMGIDVDFDGGNSGVWGNEYHLPMKIEVRPKPSPCPKG